MDAQWIAERIAYLTEQAREDVGGRELFGARVGLYQHPCDGDIFPVHSAGEPAPIYVTSGYECKLVAVAV